METPRRQVLAIYAASIGHCWACACIATVSATLSMPRVRSTIGHGSTRRQSPVSLILSVVPCDIPTLRVWSRWVVVTGPGAVCLLHHGFQRPLVGSVGRRRGHSGRLRQGHVHRHIHSKPSPCLCVCVYGDDYGQGKCAHHSIICRINGRAERSYFSWRCCLDLRWCKLEVHGQPSRYMPIVQPPCFTRQCLTLMARRPVA